MQSAFFYMNEFSGLLKHNGYINIHLNQRLNISRYKKGVGKQSNQRKKSLVIYKIMI